MIDVVQVEKKAPLVKIRIECPEYLERFLDSVHVYCTVMAGSTGWTGYWAVDSLASYILRAS